MKHKQKDKKVPTFKSSQKPKFHETRESHPEKSTTSGEGKTKSSKYQETTEAWCLSHPQGTTETW